MDILKVPVKEMQWHISFMLQELKPEISVGLNKLKYSVLFIMKVTFSGLS